MAIVAVPGHILYVSIDGADPVRRYEFKDDSINTIRSANIAQGANIVETLAQAKALWIATLRFVKIVRQLYHPPEQAKSLTFKTELIKDCTALTIVFKYEIDDDVSYEATFDKTASTITTLPEGAYIVNWVDFVGFVDLFSIFMREIDTF